MEFEDSDSFKEYNENYYMKSLSDENFSKKINKIKEKMNSHKEYTEYSNIGNKTVKIFTISIVTISVVAIMTISFSKYIYNINIYFIIVGERTD